jgi:tRNA threonylcarbamoyladenosine biosynthesis protein TsaE
MTQPVLSASQRSSSPAATETLGDRIGRAAQPADVLHLAGELGAGKTCFVRGLARGLGSGDRVSSPSFVLLNEYRGRLTLHHVDLYRLAASEALDELGLWDHTEQGVLAIEWPERAAGRLPAPTLTVSFGYGDAPDTRFISFEASGPRGRDLLGAAGIA